MKDWHTEETTEEGEYLIQTKRIDIETGKPFFMVGNLDDVQWFQREGHEKLSCYGIIAWQKIEPYESIEEREWV